VANRTDCRRDTAEDKPGLLEDLKRTSGFIQKLQAKLAPNRDQTPSHTDIETLNQLFKEARKNSKKAFGYINHAKIVETTWQSLNPAQISVLLDGKFGEAIKAAAIKFLRRQTGGHHERRH
jgi:hypothetical protein